MPRTNSTPVSRLVVDERGVKFLPTRNLWRARVLLGHHPVTGKTVQKDYYASDKLAAIDKRTAFLRTWDGKTIPQTAAQVAEAKSHRLTLNEWLDQWFDDHEARWQPATYDTHVNIVKNHVRPYLGHIVLAELTTDDIKAWMKTLTKNGVGATTRDHAHRRLKTALNSAIEEQKLQANPAAIRHLAPPITRKEIEAPEQADTDAVFAAAQGTRWEYAVHVALGMGLRRAEVIGLTWGDLNFTTNKFVVRQRVVRARGAIRTLKGQGKTHVQQARVSDPLPLIDVVREALEQQRDRQIFQQRTARQSWVGPEAGSPTCHVFTSSIGTAIDPRNFNRWWSSVACQAKQPHKTFHSLRHDCASYLINSGVEIELVSKLLRHATVGITLAFYSHLNAKVKHDAFSVMNAILAPRKAANE